MGNADNTSIKLKNGKKIAEKANQNKNSTKVAFVQDKNVKEQVVNARKAANLDLAKAKAKRRAKLAKASKKKNKK